MPTPCHYRAARIWNRSVTPALVVIALFMLGVLFASERIQAQNQSATPPTPAPKAEITKVLDDQTAAWNRGDLDTFLEGYWKSPKVVFQSGGTRFDGFDAMRDRYRKRYQGDGKAMGQVSFSGVEIEPLGPDAAFVRGRYALALPDGTHPSGLFTLIFRRFDDGWKITHDHTSTAEPAPAPAPATPAVSKPE